MGNKLRRIFCPTPEEEAEDLRQYKAIHDELAKERGCSTCKNIRHVIDYPGFVTGGENECTAGLECDTVFFTVKDCPLWEDGWADEMRERIMPKEMKNLRWRDAWYQLLIGKKIKRPHWSGYWAWENGTIMMHCFDGQVIDIRQTDNVAYTFDNVASVDWMVVEE